MTPAGEGTPVESGTPATSVTPPPSPPPPSADPIEEKCRVFDDQARIPNPLSATTAYRDYFYAPDAAWPDGDPHKNTYRSLTVLPPTKAINKSFDAKIVMTDAFPIDVHDFLPVIELVSATGEVAKNLKDFFQMVRCLLMVFVAPRCRCADVFFPFCLWLINYIETSAWVSSQIRAADDADGAHRVHVQAPDAAQRHRRGAV